MPHTIGYVVAVLAGIGATIFAFLGIAIHFAFITTAQVDNLTEFDNYVLAAVLVFVAVGAYILDGKKGGGR